MDNFFHLFWAVALLLGAFLLLYMVGRNPKTTKRMVWAALALCWVTNGVAAVSLMAFSGTSFPDLAAIAQGVGMLGYVITLGTFALAYLIAPENGT